MVGLGILLSTIATAYYLPMLAIGVLMGFALLDMVLYWLMPDALVCYRCHARYQQLSHDDQHVKFDLELNERYRQEAIRKQNLSTGST